MTGRKSIEALIDEFATRVAQFWAADLLYNEIKDAPTQIQRELREAQVKTARAALLEMIRAEIDHANG